MRRLLLVSSALIACSTEPALPGSPPADDTTLSDQTLFRYSSNASSDWAEEELPWDMCWFAGPDQTVALFTVVEAPTAVFICDAWDSPYAETFETIVVSPVALAAGPDPAGEVELVQIASGQSDAMTGAGRQPRVGDTLLVSIREARGTWFISRWVFAEVASDDFTSDDETLLDLPSRWGDFKVKAADVRANYAQRCDAVATRVAHLALEAASPPSWWYRYDKEAALVWTFTE